MKRVYKYPITAIGGDIFLLSTPKGSKILHIGNQRDGLTAWALVDSNEGEEETHQLLIARTGQNIKDPDSQEYLGTFINTLGSYVLHVFELKT